MPEQPEPTSLVLEDPDRPQIAEVPKKVEPKKPSTKSATVTKRVAKKKDPRSAVRIVRALQATSYEVQPEKGEKGSGGSGAVDSAPVNLLPSNAGGQESAVPSNGGNSGAAIQ